MTQTLASQTWRRRAACRQADPDLFFDEATELDAKMMCGGCPVVDACLDWAVSEAIAADPPEGVFGGMNRAQRVAYARRVGEARHGTTAGYTSDRCRCQLCRDAMADAQRRSYARRKRGAA